MKWLLREPVRLWLYGIGIPVIGLLVLYGYLAEESTALWTSLLAAIVLGPTTETRIAATRAEASAEKAEYHRRISDKAAEISKESAEENAGVNAGLARRLDYLERSLETLTDASDPETRSKVMRMLDDAG